MSRMPAHVIARVTKVHEMLVGGLRREAILRLANEKYSWDVKPRAVDYYIAKAKEWFKEESRVDRAAETGKVLARLETQYFKADQRKDHRGAMMIVGKHIELFRLADPDDDDRDELRRFLDAIEGGS